MRARTVVAVLVAVLVVYAVLVGWRAVVLIQDGVVEGDAVSVLLGVAVLVFPLVGAGLVWREVRFGLDTQRLAADLAARDALPVDDVTRRPSGRVDREQAREAFTAAQQAVDAEPADPALWYRLALAYDDVGDRRNARAAMRHAVALWQASGRDAQQA